MSQFLTLEGAPAPRRLTPRQMIFGNLGLTPEQVEAQRQSKESRLYAYNRPYYDWQKLRNSAGDDQSRMVLDMRRPKLYTWEEILAIDKEAGEAKSYEANILNIMKRVDEPTSGYGSTGRSRQPGLFASYGLSGLLALGESQGNDLAGFSFRRAFTPPRGVRRAVASIGRTFHRMIKPPAVIRKAIRYTGAAMFTYGTMGFAAGKQNKMFGLSASEQKTFNIANKITRGVAIAAAVVGTAGMAGMGPGAAAVAPGAAGAAGTAASGGGIMTAGTAAYSPMAGINALMASGAAAAPAGGIMTAGAASVSPLIAMNAAVASGAATMPAVASSGLFSSFMASRVGHFLANTAVKQSLMKGAKFLMKDSSKNAIFSFATDQLGNIVASKYGKNSVSPDEYASMPEAQPVQVPEPRGAASGGVPSGGGFQGDSGSTEEVNAPPTVAGSGSMDPGGDSEGSYTEGESGGIDPKYREENAAVNPLGEDSTVAEFDEATIEQAARAPRTAAESLVADTDENPVQEGTDDSLSCEFDRALGEVRRRSGARIIRSRRKVASIWGSLA